MQPRQRIDAYLQYMEGKGVARSNFAPPFWTAMWSLGVFLPPPPFLKMPAMIAVSALLGALLVTVLWMLFGYVAIMRPVTGHPPTLAMLWWGAPIGAGLMAIANSVYYRRMARRHGLVHWPTFCGVRQRV